MKNATVCEIVITGGTEVGHDTGTYSHPNGWKLDIRMNPCLTAFIMSTSRPTTINLDNETVNSTTHFRSPGGNVYYNERYFYNSFRGKTCSDHWDMTFAPVMGYQSTYTHDQAVSIVVSVGISINSTGNCSNQNQSNCTSLQGIHSDCIDGPKGIVSMRMATICEIVITGGTERGHLFSNGSEDHGTYSHSNGWKLDVRMNKCLSDYITSTCKMIGTDGDLFLSQTGNRYLNETDHWDMTFTPLEETSTTVAFATTINTMATTTSNGANFQSVHLFLIYIYFLLPVVTIYKEMFSL